MNRGKKVLAFIFIIGLYSIASTLEYNDKVTIEKLNVEG